MQIYRGAKPASHPVCSISCFLEVNRREVRLTTHLRFVPRLGLSGAIPLLPRLPVLTFVESMFKKFFAAGVDLTSPCFRYIIHLVVCLTTGPRPLPNRALHIVRSSASSFKCEYPLVSLRSSSSFLRFLPRLPVTSIPPFYLSFNNPL
jgi:hypothetical protein